MMDNPLASTLESALGDPPPVTPEKVSAAPDRLLACPAFPVSYPVVFHPELIDADPLAAMEVSWSRGTFNARHARVFSLRDVFIVGTGLVFDLDGRFIENASPGVDPDTVVLASQALRYAIASGRVERAVGPTAVALRLAPHNYGHYLAEMLPIAMVCQQLFRNEAISFLVPRAAPPMQDVIFRSLRLAGIDLARVTVQPAEPLVLRCDHAVVVSGLTEHGVYMSPLTVQALTAIGRAVPAGPHCKLFVTRAPNGERPLLNQAELATRLAGAGFTVVDPGKLSLEQQIALFKGAQCVVGVSGAAMTNIVFCEPGTSVVSLVPACFPDTFFWFIATHRDLPFMEIRGDQPVYGRPSSWIHGFTVREPDIRFLETLSAGTVPSLVRAAASVANVTIVHVRNTGDLRSVAGRWAGRPGSGEWIEAITVSPPPDVPPDAVSCQVLYDDQQETAWVPGGEFAGSRGESRPIRGFRLRLRDDVAARYRCHYQARFTDGSESSRHEPPELCASPGRIPMEAVRIEFLPAPA